MKRNKTSHRIIPASNNYFILKIFLFFFVLVIFISLGLRIASIIKNSKFSDDYFNLLVVGKNIYFININKNHSLISTLRFEKVDKKILNYPKETLGYYFKVPVNSTIVYKNGQSPDIKNFFSLKNLSILASNNSSVKISGLNSFDIIKMYLSTNLLNSFDFQDQSFVINDENEEKLNKINDLFRDNEIINEKITIEVVNSSNVSGAGNKLAQMLKNMGCNVIAIRTSEDSMSSKMIVRIDKDSYTAKKLKNYLSMPVEQRNEVSVSDITIVIGQDYASEFILPVLR